MATVITGRNYEVTPDIRALLEKKLAPIQKRLFSDVIEVRCVLQTSKYRNICEILIVGKEHDVKTVQESDDSMQDAINAAIDHLKRQAQKNRKKIRDHHRKVAVGAWPPDRALRRTQLVLVPVLGRREQGAAEFAERAVAIGDLRQARHVGGGVRQVAVAGTDRRCVAHRPPSGSTRMVPRSGKSGSLSTRSISMVPSGSTSGRSMNTTRLPRRR